MFDERYEIENPEIQAILKDIGVRIGKRLPNEYGFCLLVFGYTSKELFYISSGHREDIIKMMKEFIAHNEQSIQPR